ncbi:hypothetical protein U1Q18_008812, partial [Sarracenia purpurea var. burkii]
CGHTIGGMNLVVCCFGLLIVLAAALESNASCCNSMVLAAALECCSGACYCKASMPCSGQFNGMAGASFVKFMDCHGRSKKFKTCKTCEIRGPEGCQMNCC